MKFDLDQIKQTLGDRFSFTAADTLSVIERLELPEGAQVLDVGTGLGNMAIMLALHGYRVITGEPEHDHSIYSKQDWLGQARKVGVDHLIRFNAFDAAAMPFEDHRFDGIFFLGSLHHIPVENRNAVLRECVRTTTPQGIICFWEPTPKLIDMIRKNDPSHPEAAVPSDYGQGLGLSCSRYDGTLFDAFVFAKPSV